jgi:serine/threonine-protein kinase
VSRGGDEQLLPAPPRIYQFPRVSPDGRRIAVSIADQEAQIWVYDVSRETLNRLTLEGSANQVMAWSPDGRRIAYRSYNEGYNLSAQAADGSGAVERLITSDYLQAPNSFSPDGQLIAFMEQTAETGRDLWVLNLANRKALPFLKTPFEETAPKFSPDGSWLAYSSDESGQREIYIQPFPGPGGKRQISTEGGQEPVWNPRGGELFYRSGNKVMTVDIEMESGFSAGNPRMLFEGRYLPTAASFPFYDVSPDGERFLMLKPVERASAPTQIHVVLNWHQELLEKVPVK